MAPLHLSFVAGLLAASSSVAGTILEGYREVYFENPSRTVCTKGVDCAAFGCYGGFTTVATAATTIVPHVVSGPSPWVAPARVSNAYPGPTTVGPDGRTTVSWIAIEPKTLLIPTAAPTDPACATWKITRARKTIAVGTETIIVDEPVASAVAPPASTITATTTSTSTKTTTLTSTIVSISTVTSYPPPVVFTSVHTTTHTATATVATSVPYCPSPSPSHPHCATGVTKPWTKADVYHGRPSTFEYNDSFESVLKLQEVGYKSEQYLVQVDGSYVGLTSSPTGDRAWCGVNPSALGTCRELGLSHGEFTLPAGKHHVSIVGVEKNPYYVEPFSKGIDYAVPSTVLYSLERVACPNKPAHPKSHCTTDLVQDWKNVHFSEGKNHYLQSFDYTFPVKLTVVDAGWKGEKYSILLDNEQIGLTSDYTLGEADVWCGTEGFDAYACLERGFSAGAFVVPAGRHTVTFDTYSSGKQTWAPHNVMLYKVEKYCH